MKFKNAHILVTGGAGFIGSHLIDALLARGTARVVCLDNFSTGHRRNLAKALTHPNFHLIEGDIRDYDICREAARGIGTVLHQAALGSVPRSIHDPRTANDVNVGGFVNMLWAAVEQKVPRFIYAASSSVYGDCPLQPKQEEHTGKPLSPYALTKYIDEMYAEIFQRTYNIDTVGLRYFNVFGPRQDPEGEYAAVIPRFAAALLHGKNPVIHGDGSTSRDFTYIDNVVQANLLAIENDQNWACNEVYNVACGESTTLQELFEVMRRELGQFRPELLKLEPEYGPARCGDIPHSQADIRKIKRNFGYVPQVNLAEGVAKAAAWYFNEYA